MSAAVDKIVQDVTAENTVVDSAITFINGFKQALDDGIKAAQAGDLAPLTDLSAAVQAKTKALSDALLANTPAQPGQPAAASKQPAPGQPAVPGKFHPHSSGS